MMHAYKQRTSFKATTAFVISLVLAFTLVPAFSFAHAAKDLDFGSYEVGYGDAQSATITVQNPNNRQMTLSLAKLEGEFEIETALPATMAARSSYTVVVRPKSNLPVGTYNGSISFQLKGALGLTATTSATKLSFTVTEEKQAPAPSTQLDFGTKKAGYTPVARTVTVYNPTDQTVEFTLKSIADGFEVVSGLPQNVAPWSNVEVKIAPKTGLSAGAYEGVAVIQSKTASGVRATTSVGLKFVVESAPAQQVEVPASKYSRTVTFFGQVNLPDGSVKYYKDAKDGYAVTYTNEAQAEQIQELTDADAKALAAEEEAYKQWFVDYGMSEEDFEKQVMKKGMSSLRLINENPSRSVIGASFSNSLIFDAPAQETEIPASKYTRTVTFFGQVNLPDGSVKYYKDAKDGYAVTYTNEAQVEIIQELTDADAKALAAEEEAYKQWFVDYGMSEEDFEKQVMKNAMSSLRLINENPSRSLVGARFSSSLTFDAPAQVEEHTPTFSHHLYLFGSITETDGTVKYYKDAKNGIGIDYTNDAGNDWKSEDKAAYNAEKDAFKQWFLDNGVSEEEFSKVVKASAISGMNLEGDVFQNSWLSAEYAKPVKSTYGHTLHLQGSITDANGNVKYYQGKKDGVYFTYKNEADAERVDMTDADKAAMAAEQQAFKQWFLDNGVSEDEYNKNLQTSAKSALAILSEDPHRTSVGSSSEMILNYVQKQAPTVDNKPNLEERPIVTAFKNFWTKLTGALSRLFSF